MYKLAAFISFNVQTCLYLFGLAAFVSCENKNTGVSISESTFVGAASCIECHEDQYNSWEGSHHDLAMKEAGASSVLGNFENSNFTHRGVTSTFFKKGNDFYVNTRGKKEQNEDFKIIYTFGFFPLQQYIVSFPDGAFQCLDVAWDSKDNKWFHLQPDLDLVHNEWIHWSGGGMRWNTACADCHSTNLRKNFDLETDVFNTTFSEINVACEACHGPSSIHVDYYKDSPDKKGYDIPKLDMDTTLASKELVNKCARCHSRRAQFTPYFDYTGNFLDHYEPQLITDGLYEPDGQILDEDYVYASFVQSKMYHQGISCKDCHDVHSLKLKKTGNALCLDCHVQRYDEPEHHFHQKDTEASQCINCHMTGRYYMGNDFRRDHSFRVPRPDQTILYDTPNACNSCHTDKTAKWASDFIVEKYGDKRPEHFSDLLLAGNAGDREALTQLISDKKYPDIARATAVNYYARGLAAEDIDNIKTYLKDPSPLVRKEAVYALNGTGDYFTDLIKPLLHDSVRLVRIAAARNLYYSGIETMEIDGFEKGHEEYLTYLTTNGDFATGQQNLARYYEASGDIDKTISAYQKAIEMDYFFNAARINLALLLYQKGDVPSAEALYLKVVELEPEFSYSYFMLGLLYHESGNTPKALDYLKTACNKKPPNFKAFYNYALLLQRAGENQTSIQVMDQGLILFPNDEQLLYVKLLGLLNLDQKGEAKAVCEILLKIAPGKEQYRQIMTQLNVD
jgi:tetratricopeptide (TPR) repeat protein